jgi:hypothetical protein
VKLPFALSALLLAAVPTTKAAVEVDIGPATIGRAMTIAGQSASSRSAFHRRYTFRVAKAGVDRLEVITEMRRLVLLVEAEQKRGVRVFGRTEAEAALAPWRGKVSVVAHLIFHPTNRLVRVPNYELRLTDDSTTPPIVPTRVSLQPMTGLVPGTPSPPGSTFLTGAILDGTFDGQVVRDLKRNATILLDGKPVAQVPLDFNAIE